MKRQLRKKKPFNFYEFRVKHKFTDFSSLTDLLTPSRYSVWKYLGYSEGSRTYMFGNKKPVDWTDKKVYRALEESQLLKYITFINIDVILDNSMCIQITKDPIKGELRYV